MNEFERDDVWQRRIVDRLLKPVLRLHAFEGQVYFFGCQSATAQMLQRRAHVDALIPLSNGGDFGLEVKVRRWPNDARGNPKRFHWDDFFLETMSCSIPGQEQQGWMYTSVADFLLYCFCGPSEDWLECYPLHLGRLRKWFFRFEGTLETRHAPNPIDGRKLWSIGKIAKTQRVTRDLNVTGFMINESGLVSDLFGEPDLEFMRGQYVADDDIRQSVGEGFAAIRERKAAGGPGWRGHE